MQNPDTHTLLFLEGGVSTVFSQKMGTMQVLPVLGDHLNVYLPIILVLQCFLIWSR